MCSTLISTTAMQCNELYLQCSGENAVQTQKLKSRHNYWTKFWYWIGLMTIMFVWTPQLVVARLQLANNSRSYNTSSYFQTAPILQTDQSKPARQINGFVVAVSLANNCTLQAWPAPSDAATKVLKINSSTNKTFIVLNPESMTTSGCQSYRETLQAIVNYKATLLTSGYPELAAVLITANDGNGQGPSASYCRSNSMLDDPCYKPPDIDNKVIIAILNDYDGQELWSTVQSNKNSVLLATLQEEAGPWNNQFTSNSYVAFMWLITSTNGFILFIGLCRIAQSILRKEFQFNIKNTAYILILVSSLCQAVYSTQPLLSRSRNIVQIIGDIMGNSSLLLLASLWLVRLPYCSILWHRCCYVGIISIATAVVVAAICNILALPNIFAPTYIGRIVVTAANGIAFLCYIVFFTTYGIAFHKKWCAQALSEKTRKATRRLTLLCMSQVFIHSLLLLLAILYAFKSLAEKPIGLLTILYLLMFVMTLKNAFVINFVRVCVTDEEVDNYSMRERTSTWYNRSTTSTESLRPVHEIPRRSIIGRSSRRQSAYVNLSLLVDPNRPF
ncbi:hypothetical protein BDF19DRAFT_46713 [Syncephalis fuscata]|nr:hypothetical protein BDF19DRAFT_46713 [Syncephalis fuscata]